MSACFTEGSVANCAVCGVRLWRCTLGAQAGFAAPCAHDVPSARTGSFSERTLAIAKKILCRCGRLDIAQGGRRTSGAMSLHKRDSKTSPGPGAADQVAECWPSRPYPRPMGAPAAHRYPHVPGLSCRIARARSWSTCSSGHRAGCCTKSGPDLRARPEGCGVTTARCLRGTKWRGFGAKRSDDHKCPSTPARKAAMQLVRNAQDCASNIQCMTW